MQTGSARGARKAPSGAALERCSSTNPTSPCLILLPEFARLSSRDRLVAGRPIAGWTLWRERGTHTPTIELACCRCGPARLRPSDAGEIPALEAAVSLTASIAFSINHDCLVDLLLAGPQLHEYTSWLRGPRLHKIHEVLAGVEPAEDYTLDAAAAALGSRFYDISEAIFILLNWDRTYTRLLEAAARAGCHTTVLLIDTPIEAPREPDEVDWADVVKTVSSGDILAGRIGRL